MTSFDLAVNYVLANEKGLSENPNDPGGTTNFGISLRFLKSVQEPKKYGLFSEQITDTDLKQLTLIQAKALYHGEFWEHSPFEQLSNQNITNYVFDMAVNMGISPAIKCLQRACWAVYHNKYILPEDGILGQKTLVAVNTVISSAELLSAMRSERAGDYRVIVAHNPDQKEFINGWLTRAYDK